uniref:Uncharacterized protein n=1 Tax=Peronospora matthiolae TaxID=2874970 RepID=A0AAV1UDG0_9STRA
MTSGSNILESMFKIWLKANVLPEDAYHIMPVAVGEQGRDQQNSPSDWPTVSDELVDQLDYVDTYSAKFAAHPSDAVFELLMKNERTTAEGVRKKLAWVQSSESISDEEKKVIEQLEELWLQYVERCEAKKPMTKKD